MVELAQDSTSGADVEHAIGNVGQGEALGFLVVTYS